MNTEILQGKWHQLKGSAKAQWGKLTDHSSIKWTAMQRNSSASCRSGTDTRSSGRNRKSIPSWPGRRRCSSRSLSAPSLPARCQRPLG